MAANLDLDSLFKYYFNNNYSYNELLQNDGNLRPNWETFFQSFHQLGHSEINDRTHDMMRLMKENGVTYNIHGDPAGLNRPWNLDLIPFLITKNEWDTIEAGLVQRAELLDLVLKDIYGERKLMKNGLLPMELIYNHPGFLRQTVGIKTTGKHKLIVYSADLARSPDGKIWILNDRAQAPSGSGYALENRTAMARVLPEFFHGFQVRRLSPYFNALRTALTELSPSKNQNPRVVILTPGPSNETYFEHSYLSSHLGFTLVQGDDLMVKGNCVWLKTIGGLEKVDVILRRVDDEYCDPLELKGDSQLGVPGLLQAVRSGNVAIANPLGSSVLENPGIMPFLENICRHYFKRGLIMPTIASWWCGQPKELNYVLEHLPKLVIKRIFRNSEPTRTFDAGTLTQHQLSELKEQIKANPGFYVGQEKVVFSSTPSFINGKIEPRNALFRGFLVSNNDSYIAMAGGLTRTAAKTGNTLISNQLGGISKDTWVISSEAGQSQSQSGQSQTQLQPLTNEPKEIMAYPIAGPNNMIPSHTAENLFWVGRYTERLLLNARFQRTVMKFLAEGNRLLLDNYIDTEKCLLEALKQITFTYTEHNKVMGDGTPWPELKDILFNEERQGSLSCNLQHFKRTVYAVRDHWSTDTWRVMRNMEEDWAKASAYTDSNGNHNNMLDAVDSLITSMVAFIGLNRESISREQGWTMLDMGRKIEQSLMVISMLRATLVNKFDEQVGYNLHETVLITNESLVNYRYKYRAHIQLPLVLDLLLLDPNNPRSLIYQLDRLKAYINNLPKVKPGHELAEHERIILEAYTLLKLADKDKLSILDKDGWWYPNLDGFLSKMYELLSVLPNIISKTYFKHAQPHQQLFMKDNV